MEQAILIPAIEEVGAAAPESGTIAAVLYPEAQFTQSYCPGEKEPMTPEERFKGLETQSRDLLGRVATIEGKLEARAQGQDHTLRNGLVFFLLTVLVGYLGWLGVTVVGHGDKLSQILVLIAPEKLVAAATQPTEASDIKAAKQILAIARKNDTRLAVPLLNDTGGKFLTAAETHPESWDAVLAFLNYRSFLNEGSLPVGRNDLSKATDGKLISNFKFHTEGKGDVSFDVSWANTIVPISQSYIYQPISEPLSREVGHQYLYVHNQKGEDARMGLDGYHLKNVIFEGVHIAYHGGPLILENVTFINCTFDVARTVPGIGFAKILLSPTPTVSFNAT